MRKLIGEVGAATRFRLVFGALLPMMTSRSPIDYIVARRPWKRIGSGPAIGAAGGPGAVRYAESVVFGERLLFFFERTRADGAHELCMSSARLSGSGRGSSG